MGEGYPLGKKMQEKPKAQYQILLILGVKEGAHD
jgi:hypothetical protein